MAASGTGGRPRLILLDSRRRAVGSDCQHVSTPVDYCHTRRCLAAPRATPVIAMPSDCQPHAATFTLFTSPTFTSISPGNLFEIGISALYFLYDASDTRDKGRLISADIGDEGERILPPAAATFRRH